MSPEQFSYWLQGFVELNEGKAPTAAQWKSIKEHLAEVFTKVTPPIDRPPAAPQSGVTQEQLDKVLREMKRSTEQQRRYPTFPGRIC